MNERPLISVIMPVFNSELYLKDSIESILKQSYKNFELIIINDGSTDRSDEIVKKFKDSRVKYFLNEKNLKIVESLNKGILIANGAYIARMDSDDISFPNRLEVQLNFLETHPEIDLIGSAIKTFGAKEELCFFPENRERMMVSLLLFNNLAHPTVFGRAHVFKKNPYDQAFCYAEDYELWTRLIFNYNIACLGDILLRYRIHESQTSVFKQAPIHECVRLKYAKKLFNLNDIEILDYQKFINFELVEKSELLLIMNLLDKRASEAGILPLCELYSFFRYVVLNTLLKNKSKGKVLNFLFNNYFLKVLVWKNKKILIDVVRFSFNRPPKFYPIFSQY